MFRLRALWCSPGSFMHHDIWVQNAILAVTAIIGLWALRSSRVQERRRATVDVVLQGFEDTELRKARLRVNELVRTGLDIPHLLSNDGTKDRFAIFTVLNRYEFIAAGLREDSFDRKVYKRVVYSSAIRDWHNLSGFIDAYRHQKQHMTIYQEFERLVKDWKRDPLKADQRRKQ